MSKTYENLMAAFAGESQANRRYLAFAKKAEQEGLVQIAKLFRAAAHAETVHAMNHFKAAGEVKSTAENLQAAIGGENYEVATMYPPMLAEADASGDKAASRSFGWALEVEKIHEKLYKNALEKIGKEQSKEDYYVCPACGFTHEGPLQGKCPICGMPGEKFDKVE